MVHTWIKLHHTISHSTGQTSSYPFHSFKYSLNALFCTTSVREKFWQRGMWLTRKWKNYLGAVVSPGPKLHGTVLQVKREEGDVDGAGRLIIGWRRPRYGSVVLDDSLGDGAFKTPVRAVERERSEHSSVVSPLLLLLNWTHYSSTGWLACFTGRSCIC